MARNNPHAIQQYRGTTEQVAKYTGPVGEIVVDTTKNTVVVQDGTTTGGHALAKEAVAITGDTHVQVNTGSNATLADQAIALSLNMTGIATDLVSTDANNGLTVGGDGKLFASSPKASLVIAAGDKILKADENEKIASQLGVTYDQPSGKLTITGVDGTEVATATIPSSTSALKGVELVNGMPSAEGDEVAGDYHVSVMLKDDTGAWTDPVGVVVNTTKGTAGTKGFTVPMPEGGTTIAAVRAIFMGDDKQQTGASSPISVVFDDTSTASISWTVQDQNINGSVSFTPQIGIKAGTYLHFVWLLSDGSVRDTYVDVTDLIDIYTAGQGISISGKEIAAKLGAGSGLEFDGTGNIVFNASVVSGKIVDAVISTDAGNIIKKGTDNKLVAKPVSTDAGNLATAGADGAVLVSKEGITDAVKEIVTESLTSPDTSLACDMISETTGNQLTCDNGKLMIVSDYGTM